MPKRKFTEMESLELFFENCKKVGQECGEHFSDVGVGGWYIVVACQHWSIWERVSDDPKESKRIIEYFGFLNKWDFYRAMELISAFLKRGIGG